MSSKFPVHDISHKPLRTQQGNIELAKQFREDEEVRENPIVDHSPALRNPTPESAHKYFVENAGGEFAVLYTRTAEWLKEFIQLRSMKSRFDAVLKERSEDNPSDKI